MPQPIPPFTCTYSPQVPELLYDLGCSIALSTYQAGKLVIISAKDRQSLSQLPRYFEKAMGVAEDPHQDKLAIAFRDSVTVFRNSSQLAEFYPKSPGVYDAMYMPRSTYHTGPLDIHDVHFDADGGEGHFRNGRGDKYPVHHSTFDSCGLVRRMHHRPCKPVVRLCPGWISTARSHTMCSCCW